jgi:hypothetical protein
MDIAQKNKMDKVSFSPLPNTNKTNNINSNNNEEEENKNKTNKNENVNETINDKEKEKDKENVNDNVNDNENDDENNSNNNNVKDFIYESPKNLINNTGANIYSYSTNTNPILTTNSFGKTVKKFNVTNMQTQYSKGQQSQCLSNNSNSSKYPIPTFLSSSSLQNHNGIKYTIPKETRFSNSYRIATCQSIYNLTEHKPKGITIPHSTRKNNFQKFDLTPSSQDYVMTSLFEENLKTKKGISISFKNSLSVYYIIL